MICSELCIFVTLNLTVSFRGQSNIFGRASLVNFEFDINLDKRTKNRPPKSNFIRILYFRYFKFDRII